MALNFPTSASYLKSLERLKKEPKKEADKKKDAKTTPQYGRLKTKANVPNFCTTF